MFCFSVLRVKIRIPRHLLRSNGHRSFLAFQRLEIHKLAHNPHERLCAHDASKDQGHGSYELALLHAAEEVGARPDHGGGHDVEDGGFVDDGHEVAEGVAEGAEHCYECHCL